MTVLDIPKTSVFGTFMMVVEENDAVVIYSACIMMPASKENLCGRKTTPRIA